MVPSLLTRRPFATAGFMLRIKPLRLAGGYRAACATTPARERPRTGFVALANAVPALPASALSRRGRVLPAACYPPPAPSAIKPAHGSVGYAGEHQSGALARPGYERWSG